LTAVLLASALSSCSPASSGTVDNSSTSSVAFADSAWLKERLGDIPNGVTIGTADSLGIDMTAFEDDGYIIRANKDETLICAKGKNGLDLAVRKYAKAYEKGEAEKLDITYHEGYRIKKLLIAGADISEFTIVTPSDANENVKFAVSELQRLIEKATGVKLPISDSDVTGHKFTFAFTEREDYKFDGYNYEVKNGNVNFTGAVDRGNMYAVWRFLENEMGWKNLIYGDSVLTCADIVEIPEGTAKEEVPAFSYLNLYGNTHKTYTNDRKTPNDVQNNYGAMPEAHHGMHWNMWVEENFAANQICYTSEEKLEECHDNIENHIKIRLNNGEEIGKSLKYIDIAQADNSNYCNCSECRKVYKEEGSNSGAMIRFANSLSEWLNQDYDGLCYLVFAYAGTNIAPKVTVPNKSVWITFCYDVNCSNHRVDGSNCTTYVTIANREPRTNATYASWIEGWSALTKNIYVWFYELDNTVQQYTIFNNMYYDFEYFHNLGVQGIFFQCQNHGLGIQYIAHMVLSELNWNMAMTEDEYYALIDELLELEFGDGWENIKRYNDIHTTAQELVDCWHCWGWTYHTPMVRMYDEYYLAEHFEECRDLFEDAIYLANSRLQEHQATAYSIHLLYQGCYCGYKSAYQNNDREMKNYWADTYKEMLRRMEVCGFKYDDIYTVDGARVKLSADITTELWDFWVTEGGRNKWYADLKR